jgi:sn-glycerol 3-phosphate transport system substrate-binding protein
MTAVNNEWVNDLAKDYKRQPEGLQGHAGLQGQLRRIDGRGDRAFRAGSGRDILQVFEVGTATMMASKGAIVRSAR